MDAAWGSGFYSHLSKELKKEFPDMQGFSATNLNYCKRFYQFYANNTELSNQISFEIKNGALICYSIIWNSVAMWLLS